MQIEVDGQDVSGFAPAPCSPGPCSTSGTWTMNGADWAEGQHQVTVIATDHASNVSTKTLTVTVHHADSQPVGPGTVNLQTGEFDLSSTDVSLPGFSGDLDVTRSYASQHLSAGTTGPLGPGWSLALPQGSQVGSFQSLSVSPGGGAVLTDAGGNQSIWASAGNNSFNPPAGYEGFQLTGSGGVGTAQEYGGPSSGAGLVDPIVGPDGALWFTEWSADQIGRMDPSTHAVTEYKIPTASAEPYGIVVGPDRAIWFTEYGTNKIGRLDPSKASPGTSNGITEYTVPTANSGPVDIASGPDRAIWFTELSGGKIRRLDPSTGAITETAVQGSAPRALVVGPDGALWFGDDGNNEIGTITTGSTPSVHEYPIPTPGATPTGIAVGSDGALWFTEYSTGKIGRITTDGTVTEYTIPTANSEPLDVAAGADGKIWFTESGAGNVASMNLSAVSPGTSNGIAEYGLPTSDASPHGLISGSEGSIWVAEWNTSKLASVSLGTYKLTDTDGYTRTFAPTSTGQYAPTQDTAPTAGSPTVTSSSSYTTVPGSDGTSTLVAEPQETISAAPGVTCTGSGALTTRGCRTLTYTYAASTTATGNTPGDYTGRLSQIYYTAWDPSTSAMQKIQVAQYRYDNQGRLVAEWDPRISPALETTYSYDAAGHVTGLTPPGLAAWTFNYGTIPGDSSPGRLLSVSRPDPTNGTATTTVAYNVPLSGSGAPYAMGSSDVSAWAQTDEPANATAIFPPDEVPGSTPPSDYNRATIYYFDAQGNTVNTAAPGGRISTTEYDSHFNVIRTLTPANRAEALAAGLNSANEAKLIDTEDTYATNGIDLTDELGPQHSVQLANGTVLQAREDTQYTYGDTSATAAHKPTQVTEGAQVAGQSGDQDVRTTTTTHDDALGEPLTVTTDAGGLNLAHTTVYDDSTGNPVETIQPGNPTGGDAHETDTVYYSNAPNGGYPTCGGHPEWANLPCETLPAAQPGTAGLPDLPTTTYTYNIWGQSTTTTDTSGGQTRTTTDSYDSAGRLSSTAISATSGDPVPTVSYSYDPNTGLQIEQSTSDGRNIKTAYDSLGRMTSYQDADDNTSSYTYDIDGRVTSVNDGKGTQTYSYDVTTGDLTTLTDSAAGAFTAGYNADGAMTSETYPNGMTAGYSFDETGAPTALTYVQNSANCSSNCTWFTDTVRSSIHGQWLHEQDTLGVRDYAYDGAGRLTQAQDTPSDQGCTTRQYAYDPDSNRLSLTTIQAGSGGSCSTTGGTLVSHSYDAADRLTDQSVSYDAWGDTLTLPAADAGGYALTSTYYATGALHTQAQSGETISYSLDPASRVRERVGTGNTSSDEIDHYSDSADSPSWTSTASDWTRNIEGIDGNLAATQSGGGSITLQVVDLHGDVIGTVADTTTATPSMSQDTDEFGVPASTATVKRYDWLGGKRLTTALPTGVLDMGDREYIPELGRFDQVDPIAGGSANAYDYAYQDPINATDLNGDAPEPLFVTCGLSFSHSYDQSDSTYHYSARLSCNADVTVNFRAWLDPYPSLAYPLTAGSECRGYTEDCTSKGTYTSAKRGLAIYFAGTVTFHGDPTKHIFGITDDPRTVKSGQRCQLIHGTTVHCRVRSIAFD